MTERPVRLGPHGLFAMETSPGRDETPDRPMLVFLSAGALDHTGPGRLWVDLARSFALAGLRSLRVDLDGIGETFGRPAQGRNVPKPPEAIDDLCDLAHALDDPDAEHLALIGLSSGGYHAIEAGLRLHPTAVCAINPGLASWVPEVDEGQVDPRRRAYRPMPEPLRRLAIRHARVARWIWRGALQVRPSASPTAPLAEVAERGARLFVIVNEVDADQFVPTVQWAVRRRRLERRGLLEIEIVPGGDHSLYTADGRRRATELLERWAARARCTGALSLATRRPT